MRDFFEEIVGYEDIAEFFVFCVPSRIPVFDYTDTKTVGIYFLAHNSVSPPYSFSFTAMVMWLVLFRMRSALPLPLGIILLRVMPGVTKHSET